MRGSPDNQGRAFFAYWYGVLQKNKTGGAALPLVGMAVGFFAMETSFVAPQNVRDGVAWLGFYLTTASARTEENRFRLKEKAPIFGRG